VAVATQLPQQSPLEYGKELIPAQDVVLLFEFYRLCKPSRLCWRRNPAGISHACARDFVDWITLAGDIARI